MPAPSDVWYILQPDGRVYRAASTLALRRQVLGGQVPFESRVRRSPDEEWVALEYVHEFADLAPVLSRAQGQTATVAAAREAAAPPGMAPASIASRLDPMRLQMIGIRGLLEELVAALDSTLVRRKMLIAATAGILAAGVIALFLMIWPLRTDPDQVATFYGGLAAAVVALVVIAAVSTTLLAQITYVELSRLRPASWAEARAGTIGNTLRLIAGSVVTVGLPLVAIGVVRWATTGWDGFERPAWLAGVRGPGQDLILVGGVVLQMILWAVLYFALLLCPILVVEECSLGRALLEWCRLLQRQFSRVILYETVALGMAALAALPLFIPLALAAGGRLHAGGSSGLYGLGLLLLAGLAAAPSIAYLAVANVFIFLNLQYETHSRRR